MDDVVHSKLIRTTAQDRARIIEHLKPVNLANPKTLKDIASALNINEQKVYSHLRNLVKKDGTIGRIREGRTYKFWWKGNTPFAPSELVEQHVKDELDHMVAFTTPESVNELISVSEDVKSLPVIHVSQNQVTVTGDKYKIVIDI